MYGLWSSLARPGVLASVPSVCYKEVLRRPRAPTFRVHRKEARVCGSTASWIRNASSSQISARMSHFKTNNVSFSVFPFHSCTVLKNYSLDFAHTQSYRKFHVKQQHIQDDDANSSSNNESRKSEKDKEYSTFFKCAFFAGSSVVFTFYSFGFADTWERFINSLERNIKRIEDPDMKIVVNDHAIVRTLIISVNILLFGLWKIPSMSAGMSKLATVGIASGLGTAFIPMLVSVFSHSSFLHLFLNMYVFSSFAKAWESYAYAFQHALPKDLMSADKFLAFYLSAGFVANAGSLIVKHIGKLPVSSLGASGAILALLGYICSKMPNSRLSIAFLPNFTFSAKSGLVGIAMFDMIGLLVGIVSKWRYQIFDHTAHLTGLFFGIWYANYGEQLLYEWANYIRSKLRNITGKR